MLYAPLSGAAANQFIFSFIQPGILSGIPFGTIYLINHRSSPATVSVTTPLIGSGLNESYSIPAKAKVEVTVPHSLMMLGTKIENKGSLNR